MIKTQWVQSASALGYFILLKCHGDETHFVPALLFGFVLAAFGKQLALHKRTPFLEPPRDFSNKLKIRKGLNPCLAKGTDIYI